MDNCLFCRIVSGDIPSYTIYEDDEVKVFLDINPTTNGDCLIVPKKHYTNINDIDLDTLNHISKVSKELYTILKEKLNCEGITFIQNNDYGQEIKHYHLHATPRYKKDNLIINSNKKELLEVENIFNKIKQN